MKNWRKLGGNVKGRRILLCSFLRIFLEKTLALRKTEAIHAKKNFNCHNKIVQTLRRIASMNSIKNQLPLLSFELLLNGNWRNKSNLLRFVRKIVWVNVVIKIAFCFFFDNAVA